MRMPQTSESPRLTAVPAKRSSAVGLKARLTLVFVAIGATSAIGLFSGVAWLTSVPEVPAASSYQAKARGAAETVALDWLNGRTVDVGLAKNLTNGNLSQAGDGATEQVGQSFDYTTLTWSSYTTSRLGDGATYEVHKFLITAPPLTQESNAPETMYTLSVTMLLIPGGNPVLGAAPSLDTYVPNNSSYNFDYSGVLKTTDVPSPVRTIIEEWGKAYATNNTQQLALVVGDPTKGSTYEGLPGFSGGSVQIGTAVPSGEAGENLVVRTTVNLISANGFTSKADYDLLVTGVKTEAPKVVAWGPAGAANQSGFEAYTFNRRS
jgi:hypothetical protein